MSNITFIEVKIKGYPARTKENIKNSDGTLIIAKNLFTAGEKLTISLLKKYKKPYLIIKININENKLETKMDINTISEWLIEHKILKLNIAGNTLSRFSNIKQHELDEFIVSFLSKVKFSNNIIIMSGGQSGIDESAIKFGMKMKYKIISYVPKNWMFRIDDKDICDKELFIKRFQ